MDLRLRFLTAEIAILTAVASLFAINTEQWTKVYERRLYAEMALNLWREGYEQKTGEERETGIEPVPASDEKTVDSAFIHKGYIKGPSEDDAAFSENVYCEAKMAADLQGHEPESHETYEALNEQEAGEEDAQRPSGSEEALETIPQSSPEQDQPGETENAAPVYQENAQAVPHYSVDGDLLDPGVADYLYRRLSGAGIGWFYEYAVCIAYQESSFNPLAENVNGRDKGLFQFRVEFHSGLDWRNPYAQVDLFVQQMAARAMAGCDPYTMISRHMMSDSGPYNQEYVTHVLSHLPKLRKE